MFGDYALVWYSVLDLESCQLTETNFETNSLACAIIFFLLQIVFSIAKSANVLK